jgi:hypothetical protein
LYRIVFCKVAATWCRSFYRISIAYSKVREMSTPEKKRRMPSVLTSDVHNEAELIFGILENKDKKLISYLDCLTLLRGIGMNPTQEDMDLLKESMAEPINRLTEWRLEQEAKAEKERKKEEAKKGGDKKEAKKPDPKKDGKKDGKKDAKGAADGPPPAEGSPEAEEAEKLRKKREPAEEMKNIDWNIFISCIEPLYRDNHVEQEEIVAALRVFDVNGIGRLTRSDLARIVTTNGESVLSPAEEKQLNDVLPEDFTLEELAARIQGTYVPPTQEELDAIAAREREAREAALAAERAAAVDDPLAGL